MKRLMPESIESYCMTEELRAPTEAEAEALNAHYAPIVREAMTEAGVKIKEPRGQWAKPWLVRRPLKVVGRWRWRDRSKYTPHQGKQEMARRVRQMERAQ